MDQFLKKAFKFLGSFELAFILLILLGVLTFVGTLEQQHMSLFDVQEKYFESIVLFYDVGPFSVPLLGGYLLLSIFFVNMLVGGIIRMRKDWTRVGILISHIGIVLLLGGSFVEHQYSTKGHLTLYEGETGDSYTNSDEWEIAVREVAGGKAREFLIPDDDFKGLDDGESLRYRSAELPFELVLAGYARNAEPREARDVERAANADIDGFMLRTLAPVDANAKRPNMPGLLATVAPRGEGQTERAILWGGQRMPFAIDVAGKQYQLDLRRRTWEMPFQVHLKRFVHKLYPGTGMAKEYSSYVTKIEDGKVQDIHITMNEPMRYQGYTLYQSGWGPQDAPPGTRLYSTFSVVANPSDQVPLAACIVIALGLLIHFCNRLYLHLRNEARRRATASTGATA